MYLEYIEIIRKYILRLGCDSLSVSLPSSPFDISCKLLCYLMPTDKRLPRLALNGLIALPNQLGIIINIRTSR